MKIIDILNLNDGQEIDKIEGECVQVFPPKHGRGKKGPWTRSSLIMEDSTGQLRVTVWADVPMSAKGKQVGFNTSRENPLNFEIFEKDGKTYYSAASHVAPYYLEDAGQPMAIPAKPVVRTQSQTTQGPVASMDTVNARAKKLAKLYVACAQQVEEVIQIDAGIPLTDTQRQGAVGSLFISMERAGMMEMIPDCCEAKESPKKGRLAKVEVDDSDIPF